MNVRMYKALVYLNESPGAATTWVYINAENPYVAIQLFKAQYGRLLLSESAIPA